MYGRIDSNLTLPGYGEATEYCGKVTSMKYCCSCGSHKPTYYHCGAWTCPECYYRVCQDRAERIQEKMQGAYFAYKEIGMDLKSPFHFTISPPRNYISRADFYKSEFKKMCKEEKITVPMFTGNVFDDFKIIARTLIKLVGVVGGFIICHPWDIKKEYRKKLYKFMRNNKLDGGIWRALHYNPCSLTSLEDYLYNALHYHVIGFMPKLLIKSNIFHKTFWGWIYKNIRPLHTSQDVFIVARYQLTHALVRENKESYNEFGLLTPRFLRVEKYKTKEYEVCPDCGSKDYYKIQVTRNEYESFLKGSWVPRIIPVVAGGQVPRCKIIKEKRRFRAAEYYALGSGSYRQSTLLAYKLKF